MSTLISHTGDCLGANVVNALDNFWRLQFEYAQGYEFLSHQQGPMCTTENEVCMFPPGIIPAKSLLQIDWGPPMMCKNILTSGLVCARAQNQRGWKAIEGEILEEAIILRCYAAGACGQANQCLQNRKGTMWSDA